MGMRCARLQADFVSQLKKVTYQAKSDIEK
jgi:hypothetical protein